MTDNMPSGRVMQTWFTVLTGIVAAVFTALNVVYSLHFGRLSVPPTYDDVRYISDGLILLDAAYRNGIAAWLVDVLTRTWHAPVATLQASLGFALFDKAMWAPYALNGGYLLALLLVLRRELAAAPASLFLALVATTLAWPLVGYLIVEFRPDIAASLFMVLGAWRLFSQHQVVAGGARPPMSVLWQFSWPFVVSLWLKPSFSPVVAGWWLAAWVVLIVASRRLGDGRRAMRNSAVAALRATAILIGCFLPYLIVSGGHLVSYFAASVFGENRSIWSPNFTLVDRLQYYVTGEGGRVTMGVWAYVTSALACAALLIMWRRRDRQNQMLAGLYAMGMFIAWAGMTILSNKTPWLGVVVSGFFLGAFILSASYCFRALPHSRPMHLGAVSILIAIALGLHSWPSRDGALPVMDIGDYPSYTREANRVHTETCDLLAKHADGRVSLLIPVISTLVQPDVIQLCGLDRGGVAIKATALSMLPVDRLVAAIGAGDGTDGAGQLALVVSEDFPGIPYYVPSSKRVGTVNEAFFRSPRFEFLGLVPGPRGQGSLSLFRQRRGFVDLTEVRGMRDFEGPYPDRNLPVVRWSLNPGAAFEVPSTPGKPARLWLRGISAAPRLLARIRLSSGEDGFCAFNGHSLSDCHIDFTAREPRVRVELDFREEGADGGQRAVPAGSEGVLFSRIEVEALEPRQLPVAAAATGGAFRRTDLLSGFGGLEGPYPRHGLPQVVWGRGYVSRIDLAGRDQGAGLLLLTWRPGAGIVRLEVLQAGRVLGTCQAAAGFSHCRVPMEPVAGASEVELRYVGDQATLANPMGNSALFSEIRFVSGSQVQP
jgi:hypothetical protein